MAAAACVDDATSTYTVPRSAAAIQAWRQACQQQLVQHCDVDATEAHDVLDYVWSLVTHGRDAAHICDELQAFLPSAEAASVFTTWLFDTQLSSSSSSSSTTTAAASTATAVNSTTSSSSSSNVSAAPTTAAPVVVAAPMETTTTVAPEPKQQQQQQQQQQQPPPLLTGVKRPSSSLLAASMPLRAQRSQQ
jgi:hypothetical protein